MDFSMDKIASDCVEAINANISSLKKLNIIVVGKTGVGKSTLINSIFGEELATTGMGKPITNYMTKISKDGYPVSIYDTRGFELGKDAQVEVRNQIVETIKDGLKTKDINQQIHCIWYCVNTATNRIEPEEIEWLREFSKENQLTNVPVIIVLTQSFSKKKAAEMKELISNEKLDVIDIVPVLAMQYEIDDDFAIPDYGLEHLLEVMAEILPKELRSTLMNTQRASLNLKEYYAREAISLATSAAFGEGFVPIPFADSALLIPTQIAMVSSITAIFGLRVDRSVMVGFISSVLGTTGATMLGKAVASSILKFIPGAGTMVGGTISGGTAAVITKTLGEAYIILMEMLWLGEVNSGDLQTKEGRQKIAELIKERLKNRAVEASNLPENYSLTDIMNLPEDSEFAENLEKLPGLTRKLTSTFSDTVSSGVKAITQMDTVKDMKDIIIPKGSKVAKAIEVYKVLNSDEGLSLLNKESTDDQPKDE